MNLSWLDDFLTLAAIGNFSRAADERHMTQPAFSRRIMALEEWLGVDLFDRGSKPPRLTETGRWFRQVAQDLLADGQPICRVSDASKSAPLPLLDYSEESGLGGILRAVHGLALGRLPAQHVLTAHLASVLRTMVLDNRGVAWLPATLVSEDITSGRLAVAASEDWRFRLEIRLYRDRTPLGPAGERFWEAVSNSARGSDILRPLLGPVQ